VHALLGSKATTLQKRLCSLAPAGKFMPLPRTHEERCISYHMFLSLSFSSLWLNSMASTCGWGIDVILVPDEFQKSGSTLLTKQYDWMVALKSGKRE
jgi:hypothetical protein